MSYKTTRELFLSEANKRFLAKKFYQLHRQTGGQRSDTYFRDAVPPVMTEWARYGDEYVDVSGELLIGLMAMNDDFTAFCEKMWRARGPVPLPRTYNFTQDDWRNMDNPEPADRAVNLGDWKSGHFAPCWRKALHSRNIERGNEGFARGRSLPQINRGYNMSAVLDRIDEPYPESRELGYDVSEDSAKTLLMNTLF